MFVYILKSEKDRGYYIGCTSNLERRLMDHNKGKNVSTRNRRPFKVVYCESLESKEKAFEREKEIKSLKGGNSFKKLISKEFV